MDKKAVHSKPRTAELIQKIIDSMSKLSKVSTMNQDNLELMQTLKGIVILQKHKSL